MGEMTDYGARLAEAMGLKPGEAPSSAAMKDFAAKIGVSYQAVKKLFNTDGQRSNSMQSHNHSRAARLLRVNPDWLATGEGTKDLTFPRPEELQVLEDFRLLEQYAPELLKLSLELLHLNADSQRKTNDTLAALSGDNGYHPATNIKPAPTTPVATEAKRPQAPPSALTHKQKGKA